MVSKEESCFKFAWHVESLRLVEDCFGQSC